jgi:20S proteasome alpha/beta subunit
MLLAKGGNMTVCIAAICAWSGDDTTIIAMSDRMITSADVQFEPEQNKMFQFNARIGALIAGNAAPQTSVCAAVKLRVGDWGDADVTVERVATLFAEEIAEYRRRHAEQIYLRPLGMTSESFLASHGTLSASFVAETILNMQNYDIGDIQTIIMGRDKSGTHLFHVDKWGNVRCDDTTAFSAIGIGEWHATSHLMLAKYSKGLDFQQALLQVYIAKRKAEAAPGIGTTTDIFFINDDEITTLRDRVQQILKESVDEMEAIMAPIGKKTESDFRQRVDQFLEASVRESEQREQAELAKESKDAGDAGEWAPNTWTGPTGAAGPGPAQITGPAQRSSNGG